MYLPCITLTIFLTFFILNSVASPGPGQQPVEGRIVQRTQIRACNPDQEQDIRAAALHLERASALGIIATREQNNDIVERYLFHLRFRGYNPEYRHRVHSILNAVHAVAYNLKNQSGSLGTLLPFTIMCVDLDLQCFSGRFAYKAMGGSTLVLVRPCSGFLGELLRSGEVPISFQQGHLFPAWSETPYRI